LLPEARTLATQASKSACDVGGGRELHVGKARAAEVGGQAVVHARLVGDQVDLRLHAGHRVDLAAQLRDEEHVHHGVGRDLEVHRRAGRELDLVDRGDVLLRIDEQPLPVERHDLDLMGLTDDASGLYGSSSCVVRQVSVPSTRMMAMGTAHTTASMRCEYDQSGMYVAEVFDARYFQAKYSVSRSPASPRSASAAST
jgi:hypothetical protein